MMATMLPFFVYGTLRPMCGNDRLWRGKAWSEYDGHASIDGYRLVTHGPFPYAEVWPSATTIGALVYAYPDDYDDVLNRLDMLEGVPHLYDRVTVRCHVPHPTTPTREAWLYVPAYEVEDAFVVPNNDWRSIHRHPSRYD